MKIYRRTLKDHPDVTWYKNKSNAEKDCDFKEGGSVEILWLDTPVTKEGIVNFLNSNCDFR